MWRDPDPSELGRPGRRTDPQCRCSIRWKRDGTITIRRRGTGRQVRSARPVPSCAIDRAPRPRWQAGRLEGHHHRRLSAPGQGPCRRARPLRRVLPRPAQAANLSCRQKKRAAGGRATLLVCAGEGRCEGGSQRCRATRNRACRLWRTLSAVTLGLSPGHPNRAPSSNGTGLQVRTLLRPSRLRQQLPNKRTCWPPRWPLTLCANASHSGKPAP